jgi:hypothetical protein
MKIYVPHPKDFDFVNELYKPIRESKLNNEYDFFLPHEDGKQVNTKDIIKNSDLVLAEVSLPTTGQGIELGWANMLNVPILCISKKGAKIAGSLKYITDQFLVYDGPADLIKQLTNFLEKR